MIVNILKIVGIIILVILLIVFVMLLINVKYKIVLRKDNKFNMKFDFSYLFNIIGLNIVFDNGFKNTLRILFFNINKPNKKIKENIKRDDFSDLNENNDYIFKEKLIPLKESENTKKLILAEKKNLKLVKANNKGNNKNRKNIVDKLSSFIKEKKHRSLKLLFRELKNIFFILKPKYMGAIISFPRKRYFEKGIGFAIGGMLRPIFKDNIILNEKDDIEDLSCELNFDGSISLFKLVIIFFKLYFNKNIHNLIFK